MVSTGGCASSGYPIASCKIYTEKSYAFLEFRSVEEASNCMAFDGVAFKDSYLRVRDSNVFPLLLSLMSWEVGVSTSSAVAEVVMFELKSHVHTYRMLCMCHVHT